MKRSTAMLCGLIAFLSVSVAAQDRVYTEGPVMQVAAIKIQQGHFDEYMTYLKTSWTKEQQALKDAKVIVDYGIYATQARGPDDPDLYLTTTFANWAALDGYDDRADPVISKALGTTRAQDAKGTADRNAYRTVLGVETIQQLNIK
ncbi:MAG TPA: hypothetical protein VFL14_06835 [Xanthomonadales bacterium]|nr:hypothetical protein [Xanthomonadales bacterium]